MSVEIKITNNGKLEPLGLTIDYNKTNLPLMAEAIEASQTMPGVDGDIVFDTTYGSRIFEITAVTEDYLSPEEKETEREKVRVLLNSIKNETTKLVIEPLNRTFEVKYAGLAEDNNLPKCVEFVIPLKSAKAYAIANETNIINGEVYFSSNTEKEVGFVMTITGPANFPDLNLNGYSMKYNGIIAEGNILEINTKKNTVILVSDTGTRTNAMIYYKGSFPKIQKGLNNLISNTNLNMNQVKIKWDDLLL